MTDSNAPYIQRKAGDPWTVEDFHEVQNLIQKDIQGSITKAIDDLRQVDKAGDAEKFGGKSPDDYAQAIVDRVLAQLPKRTGYRMVFRNLALWQTSIIEHGLGAFPLVDLYYLDYFRVVASEDGEIFEAFATFYLYHDNEGTVHAKPEGAPRAFSVPIDPRPPAEPYRIPFETMLKLYNVQYDDDTPLGDVEADFWNAFFNAPNERFPDDQHFHSPWFDRCCRENRSVRHLRRDWENLYFQVRPNRVPNEWFIHVELAAKGVTAETKALSTAGAIGAGVTESLTSVTAGLGIAHFSFDTLGVGLAWILFPDDLTSPISLGGDESPPPDPVAKDRFPVMLLLKV